MNKLLFLVVFVAGALSARCQEIGILPQQKAALAISSSERNPFGKKPPKKVDQAKAPVESEESKLREVIGELPLAGIVESRGTVQVLLGSISLKGNDLLPALISGQTEQIRVTSITATEVVLGFVEADGTANNRKIRLNIDLTPAVRYKLGGASATAPKDETKQESALGGVYRRNDSAPANP